VDIPLAYHPLKENTMLVHKFIQPGNRPLASAKRIATAITLCAFAALPDKEEDAPFIQLIEKGPLAGCFFCYENQFIIDFKEFDDRYEFIPKWHCLRDEAKQREDAIVTLHPHLLEQVGNPTGY
jgi:hypothetical protein